MRKQITVGRVKGSMWYTGEGLPYVTHPLENDMYLNTIDCTVYQYENGEWVLKDIKLADTLLEELLKKSTIASGEMDIDHILIDSSKAIPTSKAVKDYVDEVIASLNLYDYTYTTNPYVEGAVLYLENVSVEENTLKIKNGSVANNTLYL
jgi:hypothetical protein